MMKDKRENTKLDAINNLKMYGIFCNQSYKINNLTINLISFSTDAARPAECPQHFLFRFAALM